MNPGLFAGGNTRFFGGFTFFLGGFFGMGATSNAGDSTPRPPSSLQVTPITALCTQKKGLQKDVSNSDPNMKASCGVGLIFNCGMAESTRQIQSKGLSTGGAVHFNERNGDTILVVN